MSGGRRWGTAALVVLLWTSSPILVEASPAGAASPPHLVARGETLWQIARAHGVDVFLRLNGLREHVVLRPGQRLRVPVQVRGRPAVAPRDGGDAAAGIPRRTAPALQWPSRGAVTSRFGLRHRRFHAGIDIALAPRTPVTAVRDGIISFAGSLGAYGLLVVVDHGGGLTTRGNATGWILHFDARRDGRPMNPLPMLGQGSSE